MEISGFFIKADNICNFFPLVSSGTKLLIIFLKIIVNATDRVLPEPLSGRFVTYLKNQTYSQCAIISIPFAGNLYAAVLVYIDFSNIPQQT